jgi:hypothetical protein
VAVSRTIGSVVALYVEPVWVDNSNPAPDALVDDNDTIMIGLATRVRIRPTSICSGKSCRAWADSTLA